MDKILTAIEGFGVVPVTKIEDANKAVPLAKAIAAGGLPLIEITFRTSAAEESIYNICSELPGMLVGAGTVTDVKKAESAVKAGAKFIVSPGFNRKVLEFCLEKGIPMLPGCSSPTDIEIALEYGLEAVKFFPAEALGGLETIKAISAAYGNMLFVPTGGVNEKNLNEYLAFPKIMAVGGSWITPANLINENRFEEVTEIAKKTVSKILGFEIAHVGINTACEEDAVNTANAFSNMFMFDTRIGNSSVFSGDGIEVMKGKGPGVLGHIGINTNNISRAIKYMERIGVKINKESAYLKNNKLIAIYLNDEINGFAVHLRQK